MIKEQDKQEMIADNIKQAFNSIEGKQEITDKLQSKYSDKATAWTVMGALFGINAGMMLNEAYSYGFEYMAHPVAAGATIAAAAVASLASISFSAKNNKKKREIPELVDSFASSIKTAFDKKDYGLVQRLNDKISGFWNNDDANEIGAKIKSKKAEALSDKKSKGLEI